MNHLLIKITDFEIVAPYTLRIIFEDDKEQTINFKPVLHGFYYEPLQELSLFNCVRLDHETHTLVWPNNADFDPATLYYWYDGDGLELAQRAVKWEIQSYEKSS